MSELEIAKLMREFVGTLGRPDVDKSLAYLTDDVTWEAPEGVFRGKEEARRYLRWIATSHPELKVTESGVGIVVQGNRAAFQHVMESKVEGKPCHWLANCTYEFSGSKIQRLWTAADRLGMIAQVVDGWLEETVVKSLVKRAEKGL